MSTKKLITNTLYFGIVPKLPMLINVFLLPILTPFLTTFDYGIHGVITAYTGIMLVIAPLGLNVHLTNSYYEYGNKYNLVWGRVLCYVIISSIICGLVNILLLINVIPLDFSWKLVLLSFLGTIQIFFNANSMLASHLFPIEGNPKPLVFTNLFASLCGIILSFVLIYCYKLGYWGLISGTALSSIVAFILFLKFVWKDFNIRPIFDKNIKHLKYFLSISWPIIPHTLGFLFLTSASRIVMTWHNIDYDDIGLYSHGAQMGDYAIIVTTALVLALNPKMQTSYRAKDYDSYRKLYFLCQMIALVTSVLICIWMNDIYSILIKNEKLAQSSSIACLMCFANVVHPLYIFMSTNAFIEKKTKQLLWLVFIPGVLNLILCNIFIPIYGFRAAVYSTMISYWSQIFIPFAISYYRTTVLQWLKRKKFLLVLLAVIVLSVICSNIISQQMFFVKFAVSAAAVSLFAAVFYRKKYNRVL
ncbi:MAG: oligosaccharide flippase family protein [Bacteroidales bacterium]|nr:oligosaccharide flippase family protein [Bacteroidales bacterium]